MLRRQPQLLHHERFGEHGPELVLLHGWGMHGAIFEALVAELVPFCRLHLFDLPGHGHSHDSTLPLDADHVVEAVRRVVPRAHWFGWSLGGLIALKAALDAPEAVLSLNLCGASACPKLTLTGSVDCRNSPPPASSSANVQPVVCGAASRNGVDSNSDHRITRRGPKRSASVPPQKPPMPDMKR